VFLLSSHGCLDNIFFQSTDDLYLYNNSLTGTIPSQIGLLTSLSESIVVWSFVKLFDCTLIMFDMYHSTDFLYLHDNNFTGEFTCPAFIDYCYISCPCCVIDDACRSF
jgi:hypothetical protein